MQNLFLTTFITEYVEEHDYYHSNNAYVSTNIRLPHVMFGIVCGSLTIKLHDYDRDKNSIKKDILAEDKT